MYIKTYKVRYAKTGEIFEKTFTEEQSTNVTASGYTTMLVALQLVNEWNRQNATSGFTYWIE